MINKGNVLEEYSILCLLQSHVLNYLKKNMCIDNHDKV